MDEDNSGGWILIAIPIALYLIGTAIWNFGWQAVVLATILFVLAVGLVAVLTYACVALVRLYLLSEFRRYRRARRDIKRIIRAGKKQIRSL